MSDGFVKRLGGTAVVAAMMLGLSGCGWVQIDPWEKGGVAYPGQKTQKVTVETIKHGGGEVVRAGSWVHARVSGKPIPSPGSIPGARFDEFKDARFWIGAASEIPTYAVRLDLGSDELRAAFVGARAGDILRVTFRSLHPTESWTLPHDGFLLNFTRKSRNTAGADNSYSRFSQTGEYQFEIVEVCQAQLWRRLGKLWQWGFSPTFSTEKTYPFIREGALEWAAFEFDCPAGSKTSHLEKGPAYPRNGSLDPGWPESFDGAMNRRRLFFWLD